MRRLEGVSSIAKRLNRGGRTFISFLGRFAFAFGTLHVIDNYVASTKQARGLSMSPTIREQGDLLLYECLSLHLASFFRRPSPIKRGDIVLAYSPEDGCIICKRVIAVEGDIFIAQPPAENPQQPPSLVVVPKHSVWLQGDNAPMSHDSRNYGSVNLSMVFGRVVCRLWPPSLFSFFYSFLPNHIIHQFIKPSPQQIASYLAS